MRGEEDPILYTPPSALAPWHRASLWGIFIFALLMRAAFLRQLQASPLWTESAGGDAAHGPIYAWLLAGLSALAGPGLMAPRLAQALIGAAACVLIYKLGRQAFSPAAGLIAGLAACVFGPWLLQDATIAPDALASCLVTAGLYQIFAANASQRGLLATSGLCLALASLGRGRVLWAAPVILLWLVLDPWIRGGRSSGRLKESAGRAAAFAAGLLLVLAPVAAHSFHLHGTIAAPSTGPEGALSAAGYARFSVEVPILGVTGPAWRLLAPLCGAWLVLAIPRWREGLCFYLLLASHALGGVLGIPGAGSLVILPVALVICAAAAVETASAIHARRWTRLALAAALYVVALLLAPFLT